MTAKKLSSCAEGVTNVGEEEANLVELHPHMFF